MISTWSIVLVPYKITLLSNSEDRSNLDREVLVPYKITLLSNLWMIASLITSVLVPYKITLLSNRAYGEW